MTLRSPPSISAMHTQLHGRPCSAPRGRVPHSQGLGPLSSTQSTGGHTEDVSSPQTRGEQVLCFSPEPSALTAQSCTVRMLWVHLVSPLLI